MNVLSGGQFYASTALATIANTFNIAGNGWVETATGQPFGALRLDGGSIVTGSVVMTANAGIGGTGTGTVNGVISGSGFALTKRGTSTLNLGGANTYSGGTIIDGGSGSILLLNNNLAAGTGPISYASGTAGRVVVNGGVTIANTINIGTGLVGVAGRGLIEAPDATGVATVNGPINITGSPTGGGHFRGGNSAANALVLNGIINSSVLLFQREGFVRYAGGGAGYATLVVTNTAQVGATNGLSTAATVVLGGSNPATLDLNGFDQTLTGILYGNAGPGTTTFSGTVALGAKTLTLNGDINTQLAATITNAPHNVTAGTGGTIAFGAAPRAINLADNTAAFDDLTISGATVTGVGVTKLGAGTLALNGASFLAPLTVSTGTLATGRITSVGSATLSALTFDPGANLRMKVGTVGDLITVTNPGGLVTSGTTTVNLNQLGGIIANGTYPLINYTGTSPGLAGFALSPVGHSTSSLIDTGTSIALSVTGNDRVIWDGTNSTAWTTAPTGNWKLQSSPLTPTDYIESDEVVFPNAPTSSSVTIASNISPSAITFNNAAGTNYTVTGTGGIIGTTALTKTADGDLTLATPNSYSGATTVQAGTLVLDYSTAIPIGALSAVSVAPIATVKFSHAGGTFGLVNTLTGSGTVVIDPSTTTAGNRDISAVTWNASGFSGILNLKPTVGTMRLQLDSLSDIGTGPVVVDDRGQAFFNTTNALTIPNNFTLSGTGYSEAAGTLGAIRASNNSVFTGTIAINGSAKIGALGNTTTISNTITAGTLTFGGSINNTGSETLLLTGNGSGLAGLIVNDGSATSSTATITVNVGNGGTTGTLGSVPISLKADGFKTAVIRFDRANGYTLGAPITSAATATANEVRNFVDLDSTGTGFNDGGNGITLGSAAPALGGTIRIGQTRANATATLTGSSISEKIAVGGALSGATLTINAGANITTNFFTIGEAANATSGVVNQTDGALNVVGQLRVGHFGTETSTYNMNGGTVTLTGASPTLSPSTAGAGGANATGDNNINGGATATIHGGGIYLGIDGTGIMNHTGGTVTTNWIVLDNRGATGVGANMADGIDRYNLSGSSILNLRSTYGLIGRNEGSYSVRLGGGTIRVDNTGTGTGTGANITIPLDATIDTVASTTTNLDTNGAGNGLTLTKDVRGTGTLNFTGGGTINASTTGNQVIAANLTGSTNLTKLGAGASNLTGVSSGYTGNVTVSAGRLNVANDLAAGTITLADGAALGGEPTVTNLILGSATGSSVFFNPNTAGGVTATNLTLNGTTTLDFATAPTSGTSWRAILYTNKLGAGTVALANAASYRVAPVIDDDGSRIAVTITGTRAQTWKGTASAIWDSGATANTNWDAGSGPDNFFAGDTVTFDGNAPLSITVTSGVSPWKTTVNSGAADNYTFNSSGSGIAGPGNLEKSGASTLTLVGANTFSGQTIVGGGAVVISAANSLGNASITNTIGISGGARLSLTTGMDLGATRSIAVGTGGGSISLNNAAAQTVTVPGNLSGSAALSFHSAAAGAGTFVLTGNNSGYTGAISVDAQAAGLTQLRIGTQSAAPAGGSITLNFPAAGASGNATTLDLPGVSLGAGVTLNMTSLLSGTNSLRTQVTSSGVSAIGGPITLAGNSIVQFTVAAGGTLTYGGPIGETTPGSFVESATLFSNVLFFRGTGTHVVNGQINLPSNGSTIAVTDGAISIINSTGNVAKSSNALFGTLRLGANDALPTAGRLVIGQAGDQAATLDLNGFNQTFAGLEWQAPTGNLLTKGVSNSHPTATSTLTINQATAPASLFNGTFSGRTNIVKDGAATLTFQAAASTFTGNVTVNAGTLVAPSLGAANGSAGSLGAANVVGKTVTVNSAGTLSFTSNNIFGNGVGNNNLPAVILEGGTLTSTRYNVLGNLTLNGGTLTQAATDGPGVYEGYQLRGSVTVGGSAASTITTTNGKANHLGANTIFNVADVTGDSSVDLTVSAPLKNQSGDFGNAVGALTKSGSGTMALASTGGNTFTGGVTINGGTLKLTGPDQSTNRLANNTLVTVNGSGSVLETADVTNNTPTGANAIDVTLAGGTYRVTGAANNHQHVRNLNFTAGGTAETQGAVGNYVGTNIQLNGDVNVSGTAAATINMQNGIGINGSHNFTVADVTGDANADLTFTTSGIQQSDAAAGVVVKAGAGTMAINGPSSFTGGLVINAGTVSVYADNALGATAGAVAISNNATLQATGAVSTIARTLTLGTGGGKIDTNSNDVSFGVGSTVTGTTLTKVGGGKLVLAGTQTYATLDTEGGRTDIASALGTGLSSIIANAETNIGVDLTLASLTIGDGAVVTFGAPLPPAPAGAGEMAGLASDLGGDLAGVQVQGVPEPGSAMLLFGGMLTILGLRRRR